MADIRIDGVAKSFGRTTALGQIDLAVSDGEFVVNSRAAKKYRPLLSAINSGRVPKFADGGSVGGGMPALRAPVVPRVRRGVGVTLSPVTNIDARGSQMSEGQIRAIVAERDAVLRAQVPGLVYDAQRRGGA